MMRNEELANRIWTSHRARLSRNRRAASLSGVAAVAVMAGAVTLWPKPAFAIQDVANATRAFRTISWKQSDEGTIRDLGSSNPPTVPKFSQVVRHFASLNPIDIRQRIEPSGVWKGMRRSTITVPMKQKDGSVKKTGTTMISYAPGPSKNLTEDDLKWHTGQVLAAIANHVAQPEVVDYQGRKALKFHYHGAGKHIVVDDVVLGDAETKRLIYRRYEVTRPSGERLYLREQTEFLYDAPLPK